MNKPGTKPLIGIVGGIASGKSAVAAEFAKLGCAVVDADAIAHALLDIAVVRDEIVAAFGTGVLAAGAIDRRKLGEIAFADEEKLATLNAIMHPRVLGRLEELLARYERDDAVPAVVLDMPLLVEVGWASRCDRVVFVECRADRRAARAKRRGAPTEVEIKIREKFQISLDSKASLADNTIDNNSDFSTLVRQIQIIFSDITKNS